MNEVCFYYMLNVIIIMVLYLLQIGDTKNEDFQIILDALMGIADPSELRSFNYITLRVKNRGRSSEWGGGGLW